MILLYVAALVLGMAVVGMIYVLAELPKSEDPGRVTEGTRRRLQ